MPIEPLVVRDLPALRAWHLRVRRTLWRHDLPPLQLDFVELSAEHNRSLSGIANSLRTACGCAVSGLFMSVTVVVSLGVHVARGRGLVDVGLAGLTACAGLTVLAALLGKGVASLWARWRLLRLPALVHEAVARASPRHEFQPPEGGHHGTRLHRSA